MSLQPEFAEHLEKFIAYLSAKKCKSCELPLSDAPGSGLTICKSKHHKEVYEMISEAKSSLDKRRPRHNKNQLKMDVD